MTFPTGVGSAPSASSPSVFEADDERRDVRVVLEALDVVFGRFVVLRSVEAERDADRGVVVAPLDEVGVLALDRAEGDTVAAPEDCTWHISPVNGAPYSGSERL